MKKIDIYFKFMLTVFFTVSLFFVYTYLQQTRYEFVSRESGGIFAIDKRTGKVMRFKGKEGWFVYKNSKFLR